MIRITFKYKNEQDYVFDENMKIIDVLQTLDFPSDCNIYSKRLRKNVCIHNTFLEENIYMYDKLELIYE